MKTRRNIDVLFVAGFGPIVRDAAASRTFYSELLGRRSRKTPTATCIPASWTAPVVAVVDHWTGSMGEGVAVGLDAMQRAVAIGTPMAHLAGAVSDFILPLTGIALAIPTEQIYHVDGTPRQEWLPPILVEEADAREDPLLERGFAEILTA
jgi:C-terminal processing protease CtpA/Prc